MQASFQEEEKIPVLSLERTEELFFPGADSPVAHGMKQCPC